MLEVFTKAGAAVPSSGSVLANTTVRFVTKYTVVDRNAFAYFRFASKYRNETKYDGQVSEYILIIFTT